MPWDPKQCYLGQNKFLMPFLIKTSIPGKEACISNGDKQTEVDVHTDTLIMTAHHHTHRQKRQTQK